MTEAEDFVKQFTGLSDEEFGKMSSDDLLKKVQERLKARMEENPDEMKTIYHPNKLLRSKCEAVDKFEDVLKTFARQLLIHCRRQGGLGMAAPQVGLLYRIIVVDTELMDHAYKTNYFKYEYPQILFNPVITNREGKIRYKEGCLSCPGAFAWTERSKSFTLTYQTDCGEQKKLDVTCDIGNPFGVVVQHEVDHLDGIQFIDNLNFIEKDKVTKQMNKYREKK
jgi:peptide deformylase